MAAGRPHRPQYLPCGGASRRARGEPAARRGGPARRRRRPGHRGSVARGPRSALAGPSRPGAVRQPRPPVRGGSRAGARRAAVRDRAGPRPPRRRPIAPRRPARPRGRTPRDRHVRAAVLLPHQPGRRRARRPCPPCRLREADVLVAGRRGPRLGRGGPQHRGGDRRGLARQPVAPAHPRLAALLGAGRRHGGRDAVRAATRPASRSPPCSASGTAQRRTHHIVRQTMRASSASDHVRAYSSSSSSCSATDSQRSSCASCARPVRPGRTSGGSKPSVARARADDAHVAAHDVPELGQDGQAGAAHHPPAARAAAHRVGDGERPHHDQLAALADALDAPEHRSGAAHAEHERDGREQRQRHEQAARRADAIERVLDRAGGGAPRRRGGSSPEPCTSRSDRLAVPGACPPLLRTSANRAVPSVLVFGAGRSAQRRPYPRPAHLRTSAWRIHRMFDDGR